MWLIVIILVVTVLVVGGMASMADSAEGAVQAAAAMEAAKAAREANQATAGLSFLVAFMAVLVVIMALLVVYFWMRSRRLDGEQRSNGQQGHWVSGPNARWGRMDGQAQQPRLPQADPMQMLTLAMMAKMMGMDAPSKLPSGQMRAQDLEEEEVPGWWQE